MSFITQAVAELKTAQLAPPSPHHIRAFTTSHQLSKTQSSLFLIWWIVSWSSYRRACPENTRLRKGFWSWTLMWNFRVNLKCAITFPGELLFDVLNFECVSNWFGCSSSTFCFRTRSWMKTFTADVPCMNISKNIYFYPFLRIFQSIYVVTCWWLYIQSSVATSCSNSCKKIAFAFGWPLPVWSLMLLDDFLVATRFRDVKIRARLIWILLRLTPILIYGRVKFR